MSLSVKNLSLVSLTNFSNSTSLSTILLGMNNLPFLDCSDSLIDLILIGFIFLNGFSLGSSINLFINNNSVPSNLKSFHIKYIIASFISYGKLSQLSMSTYSDNSSSETSGLSISISALYKNSIGTSILYRTDLFVET